MTRLFAKAAFRRALAAVACLSSLAILFSFPERSANPLWKGYRVLVASLDLPEQNVLDRLTAAGVSQIVSQSNSLVVNDGKMAPVLPFLAKKNDTIRVWFENARDNYRYFFLGESPFLDARVTKALESEKEPWALERSESVHIIPVSLVAALLLAGVVAVNGSAIGAVAGLPFVLYSLSSNRFPSYIAALFAVLAVLAFANLLEPANEGLRADLRLLRLRKNPFSFVPVALSLIAAGFSGPHALSLFAAAAISAGAFAFFSIDALAFFRRFRDARRLHPRFKSYPMHPQTVSKSWPPRRALACALSVPAFAVAGFFLFGSVSATATGAPFGDQFAAVYIPSPTGYTAGVGFGADAYEEFVRSRENPEYPDLAWFLALRWNVETAPWRRAGVPITDPAIGDKTVVTQYAMDDAGRITPRADAIKTFDAAFFRETLSSDLTPLERMLAAQGRFCSVSLRSFAR